MKNVPKYKRGASFKTSMVFVDEKMKLSTLGEVKGIINDEKKGLEGFGYDPIFYVPDEGKTFAEMDLKTDIDAASTKK